MSLGLIGPSKLSMPIPGQEHFRRSFPQLSGALASITQMARSRRLLVGKRDIPVPWCHHGPISQAKPDRALSREQAGRRSIRRFPHVNAAHLLKRFDQGMIPLGTETPRLQ